MVRVYLALYKGKAAINTPRDVVKRIADSVVRLATCSSYSHCEIAVKHPRDGLFDCYSSSARDGGVRIKTMPLPADKWDLIPLPQSVAISASRLFHRTHGAGYDWLGAIGAVLKSPHSKSRWFCSEWCAYAIGYTNPCRYSPQTLYAAVSTKDRPSEKMEETK